MLEGGSAKDFLTRHNLQRTRTLRVRRDGSNPGFATIPVPGNSRSVNVFRITENPKSDLKDRLQELLRVRKGYMPGDIFVSPWGRFLVTDVLGLKEV